MNFSYTAIPVNSPNNIRNVRGGKVFQRGPISPLHTTGTLERVRVRAEKSLESFHVGTLISVTLENPESQVAWSSALHCHESQISHHVGWYDTSRDRNKKEQAWVKVAEETGLLASKFLQPDFQTGVLTEQRSMEQGASGNM
ncbi:hypothetical protein ABVT39_011772 [Epinephelus coioides]